MSLEETKSERAVASFEELATLIGQTVSCTDIQREPDGTYVTKIGGRRYRGELMQEGDRYKIMDPNWILYIDPDLFSQRQLKVEE